MSILPSLEPDCPLPAAPAAVLRVIDARARDLGGFSVRRILPAVGHRMVGPFIFVDHIGPAEFGPGLGIDVRPHPHINLATVTYLFEGEIVHKDSLGSDRAIRPGAINWMTAGRGIVHSERTSEAVRASVARLHGMQVWVALPVEHEETAPAFHHHPAASLPEVELPGAKLRILAGSAYGVTSPVRTFSPLFYVDAHLQPGSSLTIGTDHEERAVYVTEGRVSCGGQSAQVGRMLVLLPGVETTLRAESHARVVLLGGAPLGERHMFWNFVSSRPERIEQAKLDWKQGRFPTVPGDDVEFIPLPE